MAEGYIEPGLFLKTRMSEAYILHLYTTNFKHMFGRKHKPDFFSQTLRLLLNVWVPGV